LRELLDKQACSELVARYSRALDWLDDDALKTVFWPDAGSSAVPQAVDG